jgi:small-conductance mechanosensitive channel
MDALITNWEGWIFSLAILAGAVILSLIGHYLLFYALERAARHTRTILDNSLAVHCRGPLRLLIPLLVVSFLSPLLTIPPTALAVLKHLLSLGTIASVAWLVIRTTNVLDDFILSRYDMEDKDNLQARRIYTQLQVFKRIVTAVVGIFALAVMLMTFDKVRQLGAGILASAGIVGIIVGFAAQRTIGMILAGLHIAIAQPIRVDDVVVIENEWGRIEEITFTYVVVRVWDLRRLVVPITYFIEKPFQNWTRKTADILGTVLIYVDYTMPVQPIRDELHRILNKSELWDGTAWGLQVTNATEHTVELRALMSAPDAASAWNLRCKVREELIAFIQNNYPEGLPKVRAEILERSGGTEFPGISGGTQPSSAEDTKVSE